MPLALLSPGERGEITEIQHCGCCGGGCHAHGVGHGKHHQQKKDTKTRAEEMGLRIGKQVEVLNNQGNLLLLLVDEARIAIDRRMARSIKVKGIYA